MAPARFLLIHWEPQRCLQKHEQGNPPALFVLIALLWVVSSGSDVIENPELDEELTKGRGGEGFDLGGRDRSSSCLHQVSL